MRHAEMLIGRILFLEGKSTVSKINPMHIGNTVEDHLNSDHESEAGAVANYNAAIPQAGELAITERATCSLPSLRMRKAILTGWNPERSGRPNGDPAIPLASGERIALGKLIF